MNVDFATILVLLVAVSGVLMLMDVVLWAPKRKRAAEEGETLVMPKAAEYARSFFPVFLIVLVLRSFVVEPFRIPSGSMMPTLLIGDFILVNKYEYGIRLPVADSKVIELGAPQRGDIVVFRYPENPSIPFIKRVVGLPGDKVGYYNKTLYVNGEAQTLEPLGRYAVGGSGRNMTGSEHLQENLSGVEHDILIQPGHPSVQGETEVPEGHYFVLGDNRDNSRDSRFWGTVPDENLIGRAFMIWMNWDWGESGINWGRIGSFLK